MLGKKIFNALGAYFKWSKSIPLLLKVSLVASLVVVVYLFSQTFTPLGKNLVTYNPSALGDTCVEPSGGCGSSNYWDSGSCSCKPNPTPTSCTAPSSGCGSNYYWDSGSCMCKPNPTPTSCSSPSGGCGSNYYWDSGSCMCKPNPTTTPTPTTTTTTTTNCMMPSSGCGSGSYWNSSGCSCVSCNTTPSYGCGSNYYWDSGSCMCKSNTTTTTTTTTITPTPTTNCSMPTYGCGTNYYWSSSSCMCKPNPTPTPTSTTTTTTNCMMPSSGCGSNYFWDPYVCSCKSYSSCTAPSSGCGSNYYWDSGSCSCRPNNSCTPPTVGCGTNGYWDTSSCSCKVATTTVTTTNNCSTTQVTCSSNQYWDSYSCTCRTTDTTQMCAAPVGGCGQGWYWNQPSCVCRSYSDSQTVYSVSDQTYKTQQSYDRLGYESMDRVLCVKSILSSSEFEKIRYLVGQTSDEQKEIANLGERVKSCWGVVSSSNVTTGTINEQPQQKTPIQSEACLLNILGASAYKEIVEGKRTPNYEEHLKFEQCYGNTARETVTFLTNSQQIPKVVENCLRESLTGSLYESIKSGKVSVPPEQRKAVDYCFGAPTQLFEEGRSYRVPDEIKNCLLSEVGDQRFALIGSGKENPTDEERKKGDKCFAKINSAQAKFLPPPPERLPFIETKSDEIKVVAVSQKEESSNAKNNIGGPVHLSGKAAPNSIVNIYIFSEPLVVSTKADENGDWVYELTQPLSGEKHQAYALTKTTEGNTIKSDVFDFTVVAAETASQNSLINESVTSAKAERSFVSYAVMALIFAGVLVILGVIVYLVKGGKKDLVENINKEEEKKVNE